MRRLNVEKGIHCWCDVIHYAQIFWLHFLFTNYLCIFFTLFLKVRHFEIPKAQLLVSWFLFTNLVTNPAQIRHKFSLIYFSPIFNLLSEFFCVLFLLLVSNLIYFQVDLKFLNIWQGIRKSNSISSSDDNPYI